MPLRFNNTEITQVFLNGTEQKSLRYNGTAYFGKRYSLTKNTSTGVTITVNRTSSPNQRAATGSVATGNTIYYGDQLTITATAASGYTNAKLYVNIGDGNGAVQRTSPYTFTVTGNVTYYGTSTADSEWETVWTGTQTFTEAGSFSVPGLTDGGSVQVTAHATFIEYYYDEINDRGFLGNSYTGSVNRSELPVSIYGYNAYIRLTRNGGSIEFSSTFNEGTAKGYVIYEIPQELTITEVRRKG